MQEIKIPKEIIIKIEKMLNLDGPVEINIQKNHLGTVTMSLTEKCQLFKKD